MIDEKYLYPEPKTMYLKAEYGWPQKIDAIGETKRSWIAGRHWDPTRYAKKEYRVLTEEEYSAETWAFRNRLAIGDAIQYGHHAAEQLRKVAEIIGWKEAK